MATEISSNPAHRPREAAFDSLGVATAMVCCEYEDRTAVFVSQDGRLGTLILVTRHEARGGAAAQPQGPVQQSSAPWGDEAGPESEAGRGGTSGPGGGARGEAGGSGGDWEDEEEEGGEVGRAPGAVFSVSVLMGKRDEPLLVACARSIAEGLSKLGATKPLFLSLGLSPEHHTLEALKDISVQVVKHWPA